MRKIDKSSSQVVSTKYRQWLQEQENDNIYTKSNTYYDDVVMNLFKCQEGVCAYTEMRICIPELYKETNWADGRYCLSDGSAQRNDHLGELDHFDPENKKVAYWNWDNLFMIETKVTN